MPSRSLPSSPPIRASSRSATGSACLAEPLAIPLRTDFRRGPPSLAATIDVPADLTPPIFEPILRITHSHFRPQSEGGIMRTSRVLPLFLGLALLLSAVATVSAQGKSLTIPKGTKVEKLGPGSFKLTTPDGFVFDITAYKKAAGTEAAPGAVGIIGDCGIHDPRGKLIAMGPNGVLTGAGKAIIGDSGKALKD